MIQRRFTEDMTAVADDKEINGKFGSGWSGEQGVS